MESEKSPFSEPLTVGQAAAILGVDEKTVRRWHTTGKLPSFVGGGKGQRLLFDPEVVANFTPPVRGRPRREAEGGATPAMVLGLLRADISLWDDAAVEDLIQHASTALGVSLAEGGAPVARAGEVLAAALASSNRIGSARGWHRSVMIHGLRLAGLTYEGIASSVGVSSKTIAVFEASWKSRDWPEVGRTDALEAEALLTQTPYRGHSRYRPGPMPDVQAIEDLQDALAASDEDWGVGDDEEWEDFELGDEEDEEAERLAQIASWDYDQMLARRAGEPPDPAQSAE